MSSIAKLSNYVVGKALNDVLHIIIWSTHSLILNKYFIDTSEMKLGYIEQLLTLISSG